MGERRYVFNTIDTISDSPAGNPGSEYPPIVHRTVCTKPVDATLSVPVPLIVRPCAASRGLDLAALESGQILSEGITPSVPSHESAAPAGPTDSPSSSKKKKRRVRKSRRGNAAITSRDRLMAKRPAIQHHGPLKVAYMRTVALDGSVHRHATLVSAVVQRRSIKESQGENRSRSQNLAGLNAPDHFTHTDGSPVIPSDTAVSPPEMTRLTQNYGPFSFDTVNEKLSAAPQAVKDFENSKISLQGENVFVHSNDHISMLKMIQYINTQYDEYDGGIRATAIARDFPGTGIADQFRKAFKYWRKEHTYPAGTYLFINDDGESVGPTHVPYHIYVLDLDMMRVRANALATSHQATQNATLNSMRGTIPNPKRYKPHQPRPKESLRTTTFNTETPLLKIQAPIKDIPEPLTLLVDSGASSEFISEDIVRQHRLPTTPLGQTIGLNWLMVRCNHHVLGSNLSFR